jgi:hypothetical protein
MDVYPIEEYTRKIGTATTLSKKQDASFNNCVTNFKDLLVPLLKELNEIEDENEHHRQHQVDVEHVGGMSNLRHSGARTDGTPGRE